MSYITKIIRKERKSLEQKGWILLYGRRKTGKTYLLRNLYEPDVYILVKKDRSLWSEDLEVDLNSISKKVRNLLDKGKKVVIDEFQRMDLGILEEIVTSHPHGKLILSGSSLRVVNKILAPHSALLGFFLPLRLGLISPEDMISNLTKYKPDNVIELATFLRDPWLIPFYSDEPIEKFVHRIVTQFKTTIPSLIGEVFTEEERKMTDIYEAVLALIGSGIWKIKDVASILYQRKLISEPSSSNLNQYIKNMQEMDLIESFRLYGSKMDFNRLNSPIMNVYYYLDSRYNIAERDVSFAEIEPTLKHLINLEIQNFCADLFAKVYQGRKEYFLNKEIDFIITQRNKPVCVGEVKWGMIKRNHVTNFEEKTRDFVCDKILIGKDISKKIKAEYPKIKFYTPRDLVKLVEKF